MTHLPSLLATALLALTFAGPAAAQEAPGVPQPKPAVPAAALSAKSDVFLARQTERQAISSDVVGMTVTSRDGKKVGKIDDLLLDDQSNIVGAVMSVGGFLGLGTKKVALRWENIKIERGDEPQASLDVTEQQLADAPEFKTLSDLRKDDSRNRPRRRAPGAGGSSDGGSLLPPR